MNIMRALASNTMRALASGDSTEKAVNREVLRFAIQRQIMCNRSGRVLDMRTSVLITVSLAGKRAAEVIDGPWWDGMADALRAACVDKGATLEVIDGRVL